MSDLISAASDPAVPTESKSGGSFDTARVAQVKAWLASQFDAAGKDVPEFEYTPRSIAHLHALATSSQAKTHAATIVSADLRQKAAEYRSQGQTLGFSNSHQYICIIDLALQLQSHSLWGFFFLQL